MLPLLEIHIEENTFRTLAKLTLLSLTQLESTPTTIIIFIKRLHCITRDVGRSTTIKHSWYGNLSVTTVELTLWILLISETCESLILHHIRTKLKYQGGPQRDYTTWLIVYINPFDSSPLWRPSSYERVPGSRETRLSPNPSDRQTTTLRHYESYDRPYSQDPCTEMVIFESG